MNIVAGLVLLKIQVGRNDVWKVLERDVGVGVRVEGPDVRG